VGLFKEHQTDFLLSFSCQTAIAWENARLYTQAVTDGLTRLYNRKYINERIFEEMVRSRRYGRDCSLILLDVDRFKSVNDQHGHDFGDLVLTLIANVLRENARTSDVVARFGGEEFLLLLTETDRDGAQVFASRLRESIENLNISHAGIDLKITISAGVSSYHPDMRNEVTAFVKQADKALYHAKNTGRNKVCLYGEDVT
jgi:diguanylate cyclase (GGDEF)-like protein